MIMKTVEFTVQEINLLVLYLSEEITVTEKVHLNSDKYDDVRQLYIRQLKVIRRKMDDLKFEYHAPDGKAVRVWLAHSGVVLPYPNKVTIEVYHDSRWDPIAMYQAK